MIPGPQATSRGEAGTVTIAGLTIGALTSWYVVISPTTNKPTLFGEGVFKRFYQQGVGAQVRAEVVPSAVPHRIGRPRPPTPKPFTLTGKLFELTAGKVTISEGEIR